MPRLPGQLTVEHRAEVVNGVRLHWVEKGQGPLVVLLHGFPESWWCWRYQIDPLVEAGFRVIAPDLRGYGESDLQGPYDADTVAHDVAALIAFAGERRAHLVGHDWGGAIAWHLASRLPEVCQSVAVFNCPHPARMRRALLTRPSQLRRSWYLFAFQIPALPEWMLTRGGGRAVRALYRAHARDLSNFSDEEIAPFVENALRPGHAAAMIGWYRAAARRPAGKYPPIEAPALLGWGMDDRALGFEDLVPGTERYVPALQVERLEGAGHFITAEAPDWVNAQLLAFLRGRAATSPRAEAR